jgi:hypothetical protein
MSKKEFSEDFKKFIGQLTGGERIMIENPGTGEELWISLAKVVEFISEVKTGTTSLYTVSAHVNSDGHLIITQSNGAEIDAGYIGIYKSTYQSYLATTTDNPVLSEGDCVIAQKGAPGYNGKNATFKKGEIRSFHGYYDEAPEGTHFCDGTDVPGYGKVADLRGVSIVGVDPRKPAEPKEADALEENYGAVGNTGGNMSVNLTVDQLPEHSFSTVAKIGRGSADTLMNAPAGSVIATEATGDVQDDDNNAYKLYAAPDGNEPSVGRTNKIGKGEAIDVRGPYYVLAFYEVITEDLGEGGSDAMQKSVYDSNNSGSVDNAERLGNLTKDEVIAASVHNTEVIAAYGNVTLKNRCESYAGTLSAENIFSILMPVPVDGKVNDSSLIFKTGATIPVINWPAGIKWLYGAPVLVGNSYNIFKFKQIFTGDAWEVWGSF